MKWPHLHRDPDWQSTGVWALMQCRCGARRLRRINHRLMSPIPPGWPDPRNRHNEPVNDSGWRTPPEGGWPRATGRPHV